MLRINRKKTNTANNKNRPTINPNFKITSNFINTDNKNKIRAISKKLDAKPNAESKYKLNKPFEINRIKKGMSTDKTQNKNNIETNQNIQKNKTKINRQEMLSELEILSILYILI